MKKIFTLGLLVTGVSILSTSSSWAEVCYQPHQVPAKMTCSTGKQGGLSLETFHDFSTGGCREVPAHIIQVQVECPPPPKVGRWVNATFTTGSVQMGGGGRDNEPRNMTVNIASSHAATCNAVGLKAANFEGRICAAGEARPSSGEGWNSVNYRFGKWGSGQPAGTVTSVNNQQTYCWNAGQKRDHDRTDLLVAWYCE